MIKNPERALRRRVDRALTHMGLRLARSRRGDYSILSPIGVQHVDSLEAAARIAGVRA